MRKFLFFCLCVAALLRPQIAMAWADPGHLTIAAEAYRQLSPEMQAEVFEVLKAHPDFKKWQSIYHPNTNMDLATYVFMRSSTWPDEIRRTESLYDHPNWHFVDYPLRAPNFTFETDTATNDDVLYGVKQCEICLSDKNADPELRAASLSWLVHLVGDMHQPLHCESWYSDVYTNGDRGGNDFYIKPDKIGIRLHGFWDGLLGTGVNRRQQWNYAIQLQSEFPRSSLPELTAHKTPFDWSLESRQ
jgi:hypothetical protein